MVTYDYDRRASEDDAFWKRREEAEEREIQAIKARLKKYHGGRIFDEYGGLGAAEANKLRRQLEEHEVTYWAARSKRDPTRQELDAALRRLKPAVQHAKAASAKNEWDWGPMRGPPGTGYVSQNGRAILRPRKGKEWSLILDGREHEIHSKKPGFGHAEFILQRELGPHYREQRANR
jgi:hypothetical protein